MLELFGYTGMALLLGSYFLPLRWVLTAQWAASTYLLVYAVGSNTPPFIILNAGCLTILVVRFALPRKGGRT